MNKFILIDSGFWFSLYNPRDEFHRNAVALAELIKDSTVLIPWPSLYETINTRFCRNKNTISGFESFIRNPNTKLINDISYRETELLEIFTSNRNLSMVDRIIRSILSDTSYKIDYLITFNPGDFIDICNYRMIEILN